MDNPTLDQVHPTFPPLDSHPIPTLPPQLARAPTRKYTKDQIRFVLTHWKTKELDEISTLFEVEFKLELNKKRAKYIKDTYAKHPEWIGEFGHLLSDRQRRTMEKGKANNPDPTSKENVPLGGTSSPSGFPHLPPSKVVGGAMGNAFHSAGTTNTIGLGITNTALTYPPPNNHLVSQPNASVPKPPTTLGTVTGLGIYVPGNTTVVKQMASPSLTSAAQPSDHTPMLAGGSGTCGNITSSSTNPALMPPLPHLGNRVFLAPRPGMTQYFSIKCPPQPPRTASGSTQHFMAAGLSSQALQGAGNAHAQQIMPTGSPQSTQTVGTLTVQKRAPSSSPTQGSQDQRYTPTGTPPGVPSVRTTPVRQVVPNSSPSPSKRARMTLANDQAQFKPQQINPPQVSTAVPAASMLVGSTPSLTRGSWPPHHIEVSKEDFDRKGVWYNSSHDGCQVQGRHRHNNDGSISDGTQNILLRGPQGAKCGTESTSPPVVFPVCQQANTINATEPARQKLAGQQEDTITVSGPADQKNVASPEKSQIAGSQNLVASTRVGPKQPPVTSAWRNQAPHNVDARIPQQAQPTQQMNAVGPVQQIQQHQINQQAWRLQLNQQAQQFQQAHKTQQRQSPQKAQQLQSPQQTGVIQPVQQLQQAQRVQQSPADRPVQHTQVGQQVRQVQQPLQAPQLLSRPLVSQLGQVATPHQQAGALGNSSAQRTNEGMKPQSQNSPTASASTQPGPSPQAHLRTRPIKFWFEEDIDVAPEAFSPPRFNPDGSINHAFIDRLPDIIDGEHFQHEVYDKFPHFPWTINAEHEAPLLNIPDPSYGDRRSIFSYIGSAESPLNSNPRKRQATAHETVFSGTQNAADASDSERATKKRNVGEGLSVTTATSNNVRG